jgi:hypothetical protein
MLGINLNMGGDVLYAVAYMLGTFYEALPLSLLYDWSCVAIMLGFYERFHNSDMRACSAVKSKIRPSST